ncbi:MAG: ribbon-helix-helix domain-containing protein [Ruminiclostridium sp.]|nr:ribbon-helix-helix domain-containing protein [Ruminiclostridium sp.]MDE6724157.1 ribbon-helix-helix domain-containing protein [Ruminiclostridium sp.]
MSDKKLTLKPHKYNGESTVISMRLPKDMLAEIDKIAADTGRTRNEILFLSLEFALENIEITKE